MQRRTKLLGGVILALLVSMPASADGNNRDNRGKELRSSKKSAKALRDRLGLDVEIDKRLGTNAQLAHSFSEKIEGELHFEYLKKYSVGGMGTRTLTPYGYGATANFKACFRQGRLRPYALAGFGLYQERYKRANDLGLSKRKHFGIRVGAGLDFYATDEVSMGLVTTYVLPTGSLDSGNSVILGLGTRIDF